MIQTALLDWAQNEGGSVSIAQDHVQMWDLGAIDQVSPRVILCYDGEEPRGDFAVADVTQRVDRRFVALVTRGRGYDVAVGDALAGIDGGPSGMSRPFYDLVEEAREKIRFAQLDDVNTESPPYFHSIERAPYDPDLQIYGYEIHFTLGTQLFDLRSQVNRPWVITGDEVVVPIDALETSEIPASATIVSDVIDIVDPLEATIVDDFIEIT